MSMKSKLLKLGTKAIETEKLNKRKIREEELIGAMKTLGVKKGSVLLLHISLSNLGLSLSEVSWLFELIQKAVGEDGTIVVPTFTYKQFKTTGCVFDISKTRSDLGWASEYFRCQQGIIRSAHPTHSVAAKGRFAYEITRNHQKSLTPFGRNTPYDILYQKDAIILFLGKSPHINTFYHAAEEWGGAPGMYEEEIYEVKIQGYGEEYCANTRIHSRLWHRRPIEKLLLKKGILIKYGEFKDFNLHAASSKKLVDYLLLEHNSNKYFFLGNLCQLIRIVALELMINLYAMLFADARYRRKIYIMGRIKLHSQKYKYFVKKFYKKLFLQ